MKQKQDAQFEAMLAMAFIGLVITVIMETLN